MNAVFFAIVLVAFLVGGYHQWSWVHCQVEADGRFWCPVWRVRDGLEPSILGVTRRAFRQLDNARSYGASAINCCYPALISF